MQCVKGTDQAKAENKNPHLDLAVGTFEPVSKFTNPKKSVRLQNNFRAASETFKSKLRR